LIIVRQFQGLDILNFTDQLVDAYVEVFTAPPWQDRDPEETEAAFRQRLEADARRPGFRAVLAVSDRGEIDGFVTGWTTVAPFRTDRAYGKVVKLLGAERVDELLVGAFEVDELGVRRSARGTGLGRRLLSAISAAAPERRLWLLTWNQAHDTVAFYRRVGWQEPEPVHGHGTDIVVFVDSGLQS
jgi:GNAT superfamily N-acetyltransferase